MTLAYTTPRFLLQMNEDLKLLPTESIKDALKALDKGAEHIVFIVDERSVLLGTLSDGDVRRAILQGVGLECPVEDVYNRSPICIAERDYSAKSAYELMTRYRIERIPVVDDDGVLQSYVAWDSISDVTPSPSPVISECVPVVIMAGGKGSRLSPFTSVLPKPLIPVNDRTILEHIIGGFSRFGIDQYILTLNYKGDMIRAYFEGTEKAYEIQYVWEEKFLGTAGSLRLCEQLLPENFFVSNCDIIVKANYYDVFNFHKDSGADLTIVSAIQHHVIPYGVINFGCGGEVVGITEKPEYTHPINTGVYILNKDCLRLIPEDVPFHMTELAEALLRSKRKVVTYPVNENDYVDTGQWEEYTKAVKQLQVISK